MGENITLTLNRTISMDTMVVMPGFFVPEYFKPNNRVRRLEVTADKNLTIPVC